DQRGQTLLLLTDPARPRPRETANPQTRSARGPHPRMARQPHFATKCRRLLTNSPMPIGPISRPKPERLTPPKGLPAATAAMLFTCVMPTSRPAETRSARVSSVENSDPARASAQSLAGSRAASSLLTLYTVATGPKISSPADAESRGTSTRTVGE